MRPHFLVPLFIFIFLAVLGLFLLEKNGEGGGKSAILVPQKETIITFKNATVRAETADTPASRIRGLSGAAPLGEGEGMWFDFITPGLPGIWMKEMKFSLDILWFNEDFRLVYMKENAEPFSYPEVFTPSSPARFVLEVPAGFAQKHGVVLGETVSVQNTR
jgi:uncharacterized membrane protein (UPF0127 family)